MPPPALAPDEPQACRSVLPPRLLVSESGCREAPTCHARWSRAVVGDPVASQVNSDADPMMWFGAAGAHRFEFPQMACKRAAF